MYLEIPLKDVPVKVMYQVLRKRLSSEYSCRHMYILGLLEWQHELSGDMDSEDRNNR